jgi:RNA polymerase sigma factor (sigma-70 family)
MADVRPGPLLRYLRKLADASGTDAEALGRFVACRDQAAFELLVWRHGAMVLQVCRGVLRDQHAAEDAFQATFLVLARKAKSIRRGQSLAGWLYQVAYRVALRCQAQFCKVTADGAAPLERLADPRGEEPVDTLSRREWGPLLHAEVNRLPAAYRDPVVLCYLQGHTNAEAARLLGCPVGTVSGRLARARAILKKRLTARGLTLPGGLFAAAVGEGTALAVGPALVSSTTQAALRFAAGHLLTGAAHAHAAALAEGVLQAMFPTKLQLVAAVVLLLGLLGAGAGAVSQFGAAAPAGQDAQQPSGTPAAPGGARGRLLKVASPVEGVIAVVGREVKKGETLPADQIVSLRTREGVKKYRLLREGDRVEAGQVLAVLDDRLARNELAIQKAKLVAAQADFEAARKTEMEAQARLDRQDALRAQNFVSPDDYAAAVLTRDRYQAEAKAKKAGVEVATLAVERAEIELDKHTIRSPVRGVVTAIYRQPGEAVRGLDPVVQIEITPAR